MSDPGGDRRRAAPNQVLVCHGHRHALTAGVVGDRDAPVAIIGLPSTTLGDKSVTGMLDGVLRYGVAGLRRDGTWAVGLHQVGALVEYGEPSRARPATPPSAGMRALSRIAGVPTAPSSHADLSRPARDSPDLAPRRFSSRGEPR